MYSKQHTKQFTKREKKPQQQTRPKRFVLLSLGYAVLNEIPRSHLVTLFNLIQCKHIFQEINTQIVQRLKLEQQQRKKMKQTTIQLQCVSD